MLGGRGEREQGEAGADAAPAAYFGRGYRGWASARRRLQGGAVGLVVRVRGAFTEGAFTRALF